MHLDGVLTVICSAPSVLAQAAAGRTLRRLGTLGNYVGVLQEDLQAPAGETRNVATLQREEAGLLASPLGRRKVRPADDSGWWRFQRKS